MSINYVIATYNGKCKRTHKYPSPENVLKCHLNKILTLKHNLSQITIMKAKSINYYNNYYDIDEIIKKFNISVVIIECENFGYSEGQWLKAYEIYKNKFDYYLFIEDDYCPGMNNFDEILINCYHDKFNENIGLLCSLVEGSFNYKNGGCPIHFEGNVLLSKQTLEKFYHFPRWNGEPRKWLDLIDKRIDPNFNWGSLRNSYIGGYYQVTFSHLFTISGIKHEDYLDIKHNNYLLQFPYWDDDSTSLIGGNIFFYNKGDTIKKTYSVDDIVNSPIIPIQLYDNECIKQNTS